MKEREAQRLALKEARLARQKEREEQERVCLKFIHIIH
jgi:hypothetical protein